ncbi:MAG: hypothetical protein HYS23_10890 [Geobacter sp.]|nr:hypothetical protein [Geobacter sp.]
MARILSFVFLLCASVAFAGEREQLTLEMLEYLGTFEVSGKNGVDPTQLEKVEDDDLHTDKASERGAHSGTGNSKNVKKKSGDRNGK